MVKTPTVSIIGGTIWGNRGAESMLTTTIGVIRESFPEAKFYMFSYYPGKDRSLITDENIHVLSCKPLSLLTRHFMAAFLAALLRALGLKVPQSSFFRITNALLESDMLLDVGGITFSDGREKFLPFNVLTLWPALLLKVPVVKLAQAVGPFKHWPIRLSAQLFLTRCRYIFARGEKTAEFLVDLGYPREKWTTVADVAFLYKPEYTLSSENDMTVDELVARLGSIGKKIIVISPSILVEKQSAQKGLDYKEKFFSIIRELGVKDFHYVFIPNATREGSDQSHNNDLITLRNMRQFAENGGLPAESLASIEWVMLDVNTASIRRIISQADVLVTSRYHAMISGLCLAVPTVVIGWGHKYKETMDYFELGDYSLDFENKGLDLVDILKRALDDQAVIHEQILSHSGTVRQKAQSQFDFLKRELA